MDPKAASPPSARKSFDVYRPHPWHGVPVGPHMGPDVPEILYAYVEITPFSTIKYEVDKATGYLKVDRPQRSNSLPPYAYGFIPRTWCMSRVAGIAAAEVRGVTRGDGDPLDICVVSERAIDRSDILLGCRAVGGLLMVDNGEADDKIIAVLDRDPVWGDVRELSGLPNALVDRLRHYFLTYKFDPRSGVQPVSIDAIYGAERAREVIAAAMADYDEGFPAV